METACYGARPFAGSLHAPVHRGGMKNGLNLPEIASNRAGFGLMGRPIKPLDAPFKPMGWLIKPLVGLTRPA